MENGFHGILPVGELGGDVEEVGGGFRPTATGLCTSASFVVL